MWLNKHITLSCDSKFDNVYSKTKIASSQHHGADYVNLGDSTCFNERKVFNNIEQSPSLKSMHTKFHDRRSNSIVIQVTSDP